MTQQTLREEFKEKFKVGCFCHDMYECGDNERHEDDHKEIADFFLARFKEFAEKAEKALLIKGEDDRIEEWKNLKKSLDIDITK